MQKFDVYCQGKLLPSSALPCQLTKENEAKIEGRETPRKKTQHLRAFNYKGAFVEVTRIY